MAEKKRKKGNGILFGLILLGASIVAIWKNEHRFDYHKAARDTTAVDTIGQLSPRDLFSHPGSMDGEPPRSTRGIATRMTTASRGPRGG